MGAQSTNSLVVEHYRDGEIEQNVNGTYTASYLIKQSTGKSYLGIAGKKRYWDTIEEARMAIDSEIDAVLNDTPINLYRELENTRWVAVDPGHKNRLIDLVVQIGVWDAKKREWTNPSRDAIVARLQQGEEFKFDAECWYAYIRDEDAHNRLVAERVAKRKPIEMYECDCGHVVARSQVMSASHGTSCPDCYDRMSG